MEIRRGRERRKWHAFFHMCNLAVTIYIRQMGVRRQREADRSCLGMRRRPARRSKAIECWGKNKRSPSLHICENFIINCYTNC